jgi:hypothetical protein
MKLFITIGMLLLGAGITFSENVTNTYAVHPDANIPVGNPVGLVSTIDISGFTDVTIASISISLNIVGGYNGDLYMYLAGPHDGFDLLLDQPGSSDGSVGYLDNGLNINLDDGAAKSIQNYQDTTGSLPANTQLTGTWRSAGNDLASFFGGDPNGTWTLFVANRVGGSPSSTLMDWSLNIVTTPVPEPQTSALLIGGLSALAGWWWRTRKSEPAVKIKIVPNGTASH